MKSPQATGLKNAVGVYIFRSHLLPFWPQFGALYGGHVALGESPSFPPCLGAGLSRRGGGTGPRATPARALPPQTPRVSPWMKRVCAAKHSSPQGRERDGGVESGRGQNRNARVFVLMAQGPERKCACICIDGSGPETEMSAVNLCWWLRFDCIKKRK